jgi:hypothetical protein
MADTQWIDLGVPTECSCGWTNREPDPRDRWSWFTWFWLAWAAAFGIVEAIALAQDRKHHDRVKRTLSSNTRRLTGWDSVSGQPIEVRWGRPRRASFIMAMAWFNEHIKGKRV